MIKTLHYSTVLANSFSSSKIFQKDMSTKEKPLIITVAPLGSLPTKEMTPHVPIKPEEIAADVEKCAAAGASIFHIHARDENQKPSVDLNTFRKTVGLIKKKNPNVIVQLSTGFRATIDPFERMNMIRLCPEMGSFTTGSNNMANIVYDNSPPFLMMLAKTYLDCGVKPELECFDTGHLTNALYLSRRLKLIPDPLHFNFVLGLTGAMAGTVQNIVHMANMVPSNATWSVSGIGKCQMKMATAAIAMGGHVRVGLEDNIFSPEGELTTNAELVERVVEIAKKVGRRIATPEEARVMLSLDESKKDRILKYLDPNEPLCPVDMSPLNLPK